MITNHEETAANDIAAWWATWDRCCKALDFKPTGCQLIVADHKRRDGDSPYSAVVEVKGLIDGLSSQ